MRRRRTIGTVAGNPFDKAHESIRAKELNVFYATISPQFTMDDMVQWIFPEDTIRKLKVAYPLANTNYHMNFSHSGFPLPSGNKVGFSLDLDSVHMQCPKPIDLWKEAANCPARGTIMGTLQAICDVHDSFNKVRKVIDWFGEHHVTVGAAVYYWPTIMSLLPSGHAVHQAGGERYREVTGISEIIPLLRETAGIIAGAHLCPVAPTRSGKINFTLTCEGEYAQQFVVL